MHVAANPANPFGLARSFDGGFGLDVRLIEIVRRGGNVGELFHVDDLGDKNAVRVKLHLLNDVRAYVGIRAFGYGKRAVGGALYLVEVGELVDVLAALEAEMLKQVKGCRLTDYRHGEFLRLGDDVVREVGFIHGDRNPVLSNGRGGYLRHGVDNAGVILSAVVRAQHEQPVLDVKQNFAVH